MWVKPDQHYPYEAGQYVSVETPWWPRVWRSFSLANAPRKDGLVELHVHGVDAGWVSQAMVNKARVGDVIRLGHSTGTMVADRTSTRDLVCIAGGTGLAPMKAIIEDMARWNWFRRVHLFVGARRSEDLYDLSALNALSRQYEWLSVIPAISDDPTYPGERGVVVDVALRQGDWRAHDVFISGSAPMVRSSIDRLLISGVSLTRIKFDAFGDSR
jgi:NAD(P)H-flavin reductase